MAYAIVTGLLVGVYAGLVLLATQVLRFASPVAVAASTLAAAALFNPVRRRVQRAVDRRFNRARYDADRTVTAFAARLQDAVDLDTVRADLLATVERLAAACPRVRVARGRWPVTTQTAGRWSRFASPRTASVLAALVLLLIVTLPVIGAVSHHASSTSVTAVISLLVVILVVAAVGLVVARHQPGNAIGWLLLGAALWIPLTVAASEYATLVYDYGHRGIPDSARWPSFSAGCSRS